MNYSECLDFLYTTLPMFSRTGHAAMKEGLGNTLALCQFLNHPETKTKFIHVAGTNGKGSVSHMLAAVLQSAGYKTGLYTSPHLMDFRERIRVNGNMIDQDFVIHFTEKMKPLIAEIEPSFFELTVGMALEFFAQQQVDVAVIETGLGGRLDSTNIITPELSVITNIGFDHMQLLGDTIEKIACEKAGIIKKNKAVVIGRSCPESKNVFLDKAGKEDAPIFFADESTTTSLLHAEVDRIEIALKDQDSNTTFDLSSDLPGIYQLENISTVFVAIQQLRRLGWRIDDAHVKNGISHARKMTGLMGRWELIRKHPTLIADVAHNEDGISHLLKQIGHISPERLFIVLGVSKEKDVDAILSLLPKSAAYSFTQASIHRAMDKETLAQKAERHQLHGQVHSNVNEAIAEHLQHASPNDLILVCGSVFVVGEIDRKRFGQ